MVRWSLVSVRPGLAIPGMAQILGSGPTHLCLRLKRFLITLKLKHALLLPSDEAGEVVAERAVAAKVLLVKQAFDPAAQADLVGMVPGTDWPAHILMPAAAQDSYGSSGNTGGHDAQGPEPADPFTLFLLGFVTQVAHPLGVALSAYAGGPSESNLIGQVSERTAGKKGIKAEEKPSKAV